MIQIDPDDERPIARFARIINIVEALPPGHRPSDETPLREVMPGAWPSYGDLKKLVAAHICENT